MGKLYIPGIIFLLILIFFSCTPPVSPAIQPAANLPEAAPSSGAGKQAWEISWEKTLASSKLQRKVVMYTTAGSDIRSAFSRIMKEKYGLEMEFVTGKGVEMIAKVLSERRAGLYLGDVYMAGGTSTLASLVPEGAIDAITQEFILPEVSDTSKWYGNKLPYIDKEERLFGFRGSIFWPFTINTTLFQPSDIASYSDILKPVFKGKIAMADPTIEGAANSFITLSSEYLMGRDYIKALVKQEPFLSRDERLLTEWVARGKYGVLIGTKPDPIAEFRKVGAPLLPIIPREGSMIEPGAGTISMINKRPHPNAARVFINWLLAKEGQTIYAEAAGIESAREDVSKAHLGAGLVRETGKKYIYGDDDFRKKAERVVQQSKEDFKPLLK